MNLKVRRAPGKQSGSDDEIGTLLHNFLDKLAKFDKRVDDIQVELRQVTKAMSRIEQKLETAPWAGQERRRPLPPGEAKTISRVHP
jgi:hypothetical protein